MKGMFMLAGALIAAAGALAAVSAEAQPDDPTKLSKRL